MQSQREGCVRGVYYVTSHLRAPVLAGREGPSAAAILALRPVATETVRRFRLHPGRQATPTHRRPERFPRSASLPSRVPWAVWSMGSTNHHPPRSPGPLGCGECTWRGCVLKDALFKRGLERMMAEKSFTGHKPCQVNAASLI